MTAIKEIPEVAALDAKINTLVHGELYNQHYKEIQHKFWDAIDAIQKRLSAAIPPDVEQLRSDLVDILYECNGTGAGADDVVKYLISKGLRSGPIEPVQEEESPTKTMQWISLKDNYPQPEEEILLYMAKQGYPEKPGAPYIGYLNADKKTWTIYSERGKENDAEKNPDMWFVTHWAEIEWPPISRLKSEIEELKNNTNV